MLVINTAQTQYGRFMTCGWLLPIGKIPNFLRPMKCLHVHVYVPPTTAFEMDGSSVIAVVLCRCEDCTYTYWDFICEFNKNSCVAMQFRRKHGVLLTNKSFGLLLGFTNLSTCHVVPVGGGRRFGVLLHSRRRRHSFPRLDHALLKVFYVHLTYILSRSVWPTHYISMITVLSVFTEFL